MSFENFIISTLNIGIHTTPIKSMFIARGQHGPYHGILLCFSNDNHQVFILAILGPLPNDITKHHVGKTDPSGWEERGAELMRDSAEAETGIV